ncbi:hypothetical protein SLE2022_375010 [Rubroshorea leprosula]
MPAHVSISVSGPFPIRIVRKANLSFRASSKADEHQSRSVKYDSLRILEWDKLCDSVASFARTSVGRQATKAQLWSLDQTFEDSLRLLDETNVAILMHNHGSFNLDLTAVDLALVESGIKRAQRGLHMESNEAMAILSLLQFVEGLQLNLKAAIREDADWYKRFMPLSGSIMQLVVNRVLVKLIQQVIGEDGSVKDSASPALKKARNQVQILERKLYQLMESLTRNEADDAALLEVSNVDGRWCIRSGADQQTSFKGLLMSSGSGIGSIVEPLIAVPLNDELQQARALVAKVEADVLLMLTEKVQMDFDDIEKIFISLIQLDVINARATYSLSFGGTCPRIFLPDEKERCLMAESHGSRKKTLNASYPEREWIFYLPNAYHPLLLQQHRQKMQNVGKGLRNATAEIVKKKLQVENVAIKGGKEPDLSSSQLQVSALEHASPVPVDFFIAQKTRVLVITGPNTGGKTICLKTVGLASMMAKSGLHVLSSESAQIPWFDSIFADIGDDQSLSQSLSTFSGHLKQISDIRSQSTGQSLVLLDEVGAGTNPLEGAALGMSILESFAESGSLLTIATTHHGKLKALKYSNEAFENACMEFDEEKLKPTYKILWGIPGRSNAINIAERLGVPSTVVDNAREIYGTASAEIDEMIIDMERFKQNFQELMAEARRYLMLSRGSHEKLLLTRRKLMEHGATLRYRMVQELSDAAAIARSSIHRKVQQFRATARKQSQPVRASQLSVTSKSKDEKVVKTENSATTKSSSSVQVVKQLQSEKRTELPKVGDVVHVSSLRRKATVLRVEPSREQIVVQAGNMKLKLKLNEVET